MENVELGPRKRRISNGSRSIVIAFIIVIVGGLFSCGQANEESNERSSAHAEDHKNRELVFSRFAPASIRDIAIGRDGYVYITGGTESADFPVTPGAYDTKHNGKSDAFVMKLDLEGKIIWSTFIGGPSHDRAYAVEVDGQGYVYVAGRAGVGFPVTSGAFQTAFRGGPSKGPYPSQDGFVAKLAPDGKRLIFASYFGAFDDPSHPVRDLAVDPKGNILIASSSSTGDYSEGVLKAFRRGFQDTLRGRRDGVVAKVSGDGSRVIWASYLGGSGEEWGESSIRVDGTGNVYFLTVTNSPDIPTTSDAYDRTYNGGWDFYLAKLNPNGGLVYSTYLGGSGDEHVETHNLAVDRAGNAVIAAGTTSTDFPTTPGVFQRRYGGSGGRGTGGRTNYPGDIIVAKLSADGAQLLGSTYIGGRYGEAAEGVALDRAGNILLSGATFSDNFPVSQTARQKRNHGKADALAVELSADLRRVQYSTYLGGSEGDAGRAAAVDSAGNFYIGGETGSSDWPTRLALQPSLKSKSSGFLAKFFLGGQ